jgi:hypothetical protein
VQLREGPADLPGTEARLTEDVLEDGRGQVEQGLAEAVRGRRGGLSAVLD